MRKRDGGEAAIVLLRDDEWVWSNRAMPGSSVHLDMPEMGATGWAQVLEVEPMLVIRQRRSGMVTGTFRHDAALVGELALKGESKPLAGTPSHPVWSVDRQDWIPLGELKQGERVKTRRGTTTVESYTMRGEPEPVYGIEVEGDHCYRVGEQGVLVHNNSAGCDPCEDKWGIMSEASQHYKLELTPAAVKYTVKDRGFREGDCFKGGPGERVCARDLIGKEFEHPVVKRMTFRFENKSDKVKGLSGRGVTTTYKESGWSHYAAGKKNDVPGHVINGLWNGPGRLPGFAGLKELKGPAPFLNLVPLDSIVNGSTYNMHEENVKVWAKNLDVLCVRITFEYGDAEFPARPQTFMWEYMMKQDGVWQPFKPGTPQGN
jgi:hypothetical protein